MKSRNDDVFRRAQQRKAFKKREKRQALGLIGLGIGFMVLYFALYLAGIAAIIWVAASVWKAVMH